jgi:hypothetical protein
MKSLLNKNKHFKELNLDNDLSIKKINERIENEYSEKIYKKLNYENLIKEYEKLKSVEAKKDKLKIILLNNNVSNKKIKKILMEYIYELIPPGTKGVIRGNKFNELIKKKIIKLDLDKKRFEIKFEEQCSKLPTDEIPDWYILEKKTNKVLIGMNQIDLWSGGHQINRAFNYLNNKKFDNKKNKLLCVVCDKTKILKKEGKKYKIFNNGFMNETLCYPKNIKNIIKKFFNS